MMINIPMLPLLPVTKLHIYLVYELSSKIIPQLNLFLYTVCTAAVTAKTVTSDTAGGCHA
jgi:hypothetical protein